MGNKQVITWKKPAAIEYGEALSKNQLNAKLDKGDGVLSYSPKLGDKPDAGKVTLRVTASKTKTFDETKEEVELTVTKASQTIEWAKPAAIVFGTPLDAKQLNAKLKRGEGDLVYAPKGKTVLDAGTHELKVTAEATKNYEAAEAKLDLVVKKAAAVIEWKAPVAIVYGEALSAKQLNAKLTEGDGELVYASKLKTVLDAGTHELHVTTAATKNFEAGQATVVLVVKRAAQVVEWKALAPITYGEELGALQLSAKLTEGDGALSYGVKAKAVLDVGMHDIKVTAAATKNFEATDATMSLVVKKAKPVIDWKTPAAITYGDELGAKQLNATLSEGDGELTYAPKAKTVLDGGTHTLKVTAAATKNFEAADATVELVVDKAEQAIKWTILRTMTVGDPLTAEHLCAELTKGDGPLVYQPSLGQKAPHAGRLTLNVTASATINYKQATGEAQVTVWRAPIGVEEWMAKLGFAKKSNVYMKDLGVHTGQTGKGKSIHLTIFKSSLPEQIRFSTPAEVLDLLFPDNGDRGFHITIEMTVGESSLKNPHVFRGLDQIYKGQGNNLMEAEWTNLKKTLKQRLDKEISDLKGAIIGTKWCK